MKSIKILVATHKAYEFPKQDIYCPIQVGKALSSAELGLQSDHTGEHISDKNSSFCELTALYWAWKNGKFEHQDYVGLVHYRRYFSGKGIQLKGKGILSGKEVEAYLNRADCILPKKRNYYIESVYSHYKNAHYIQDLEKAVSIILAKNSEYEPACHQVLHGKTLHLFNMFIMKRELCIRYCEWLFPILFELEKQLDISQYNTYQKRVFGFIAERLFNVWLIHNHIQTIEVKVVSLEKEPLLLKAFNLLKRKFLKNDQK